MLAATLEDAQPHQELLVVHRVRLVGVEYLEQAIMRQVTTAQGRHDMTELVQGNLAIRRRSIKRRPHAFEFVWLN